MQENKAKLAEQWWDSLESDEHISYLKKYKIYGHDLGCNADDIFWIWEEENKPEPKESIDDMENIFQILGSMNSQNSISSFFNSFFNSLESEKKLKYPYEDLGDGFNLRPIKLTDDKGNLIPNSDKYCQLYHGDRKLSTGIFRKGGIGGKFRDGYCELLHYYPETDPKKSSNGLSFGLWVIVNSEGSIVFRSTGSLSYPRHIAGRIASYDNYIYDLETGTAIAPKSSTMIEGKTSMIIEHLYDWYNKDVKLPLGIYKIDYKTAEVIKIDDKK